MRAVFFLLSTALFASAQPKALFYMIETPNSVKSFVAHADKIDTIVPAWYHVDGNGLVWGGPNPEVLQAAAQHHVPVMPIVALMNQAELHKLLTTESSKLAFIDALLGECKRNAYSGFQIDFENVNWTDRDLLQPWSPKPPPLFTRKSCNSRSPPSPTLPDIPARVPTRTGSMPTGADRSTSRHSPNQST